MLKPPFHEPFPKASRLHVGGYAKEILAKAFLVAPVFGGGTWNH